MKCPYCGKLHNRVIDSRVSNDGKAIRRRRECIDCHKRFTTYERVEETPLIVVKKDGRREPFDRNKIITGIKKACEKRPISMDAIEAIADRIELFLMELDEKEIPTKIIGERVMEELNRLDKVAYVRFASVYRQFKDIDEFVHEVKQLLEERERKGDERDSK